jgi:twitching motility two-component system response regulator PilG
MTTTTMRPEVSRLIRDAVAASRSDDKPRSHVLFRAVTQLDPENEAAWMWFANTASDPRDAVMGVRSVLRLNPRNTIAAKALPVALLRAGIAAAKANERVAAAGFLADATEALPDSVTAWLEPERAIGFLERVLQLNPDNPQAKQGIAKLRAKITPLGQCPLCEYTPHSNDTVADECKKCGAVLMLYRPERFDNAVPHIDTALIQAAATRLKAKWSTAPTAETAYALGLAYVNLGNAHEGLKAFQFAIRGHSPNPHWLKEITRLVEHRKSRATTPLIDMAAASSEQLRIVEQPRIMIVDDSPTVRRMVASILGKAGYDVTEASDAEHAATLIHDLGAPKLFILDINMPGTDGFGLCRYLRSEAETARVPVVFLTGKTGILSKIHGKWAGSAEYLTKPFQPEKLIATANRLVPITKQ